MQKETVSPTELTEFIKKTLPRAHGHQIKGITKFVLAIIDKQTGNQAELARGQGNQEAATKQLARLIHNPRLKPGALPEWICRQALRQVPKTGQVRFTIDWTIEDEQHLLVVSLVVGHRALPIYWRAYTQAVLKGRMKRYERAVIKRAFALIFHYVTPARIRLTADRGFPDDELFALLAALGIHFVIRVKSNVKVCYQQRWVQLKTLKFAGNARHRNLGKLAYCASAPRQLWVTMSRARNKKGKLMTWYLVSNQPLRAQQAAREYAHRFSCEEGFRDTKWYLGFKKARVQAIKAWARLFALFALALLVLTTLGMKLLIKGGQQAHMLLRRVASRRRGRCELGLISAMIYLVQEDHSLLSALSAQTKLKLEACLPNVS